MPALRFYLTMFCVIITNVWCNIWNSYMARGWFAFLWIFQKNCIDNISSKSQERQRLITFILVDIIQYPRTLKNNIHYSAALRCGSFSEKNIEKKHLYCHDKNYYYFCKSNIRIINLIVGSRNMIEVSKNMSLRKIR